MPKSDKPGIYLLGSEDGERIYALGVLECTPEQKANILEKLAAADDLTAKLFDFLESPDMKTLGFGIDFLAFKP